MRAAIFIERDGVLNLERIDGTHWGSPMQVDQFQINSEAQEPLRLLKEAGFLLIATTNQPHISRGSLNRGEMDRMHTLLRKAFPLDDIMVCPHDSSDFCPCRKPKPGLITEAAFKWHIHLPKSYVISNKWPDAEAARNAGCTSLLIRSPWIGTVHHDMVLSTLGDVVEKILQMSTPMRQVAV